MPISKVITEGRIPVKVYASKVEDNIIEQLVNTSNVPGAFHHIAVMPDVHFGMGIAIGTVLATHNTIIPSAVGADIGCGMCAQRFDIEACDAKKYLEDIHKDIKAKIPTGFAGRQKISSNYNEFYSDNDHTKNLTGEVHKHAPHKFGTLGGGNHFIELCEDQDDGAMWLVLHSGSRKIGNVIGLYYGKLAKKLNEKWHSNSPKDLEFLPVDSDEGQDYIKDMIWAQAYAMGSRELMLKDIIEILENYGINTPFHSSDSTSRVNIHHNFAQLENHFGKNVWIHRKGATQARTGQLGIVPGSMGVGSFIVEGLGNRDSFMSCSHGAGRTMSRKQAKNVLAMEGFRSSMEGIVADVNEDLLDEAPAAYKDLGQVMEDQSDLIKPIHRLKPVLNVKGQGRNKMRNAPKTTV